MTYISTDINVSNDTTLVLRVDTDIVFYDPPYRIKPFLPSNKIILDHNTVLNGELLIKHERTLNQLNFDVNDVGQLVCIGEDANQYYISDGTDGYDIGDLIYSYDETDVGIGAMIIGTTFIIR